MEPSAPSFVGTFVVGLSCGLGVGLTFFLLGRLYRRAFGLIGRAALMR